MTDLLRQIADKLDDIEAPDNPVITDPKQVTPDTNDPLDKATDPRAQPVYMSPLQQKLELLKVGVGVDSEFDVGNRDPDEEMATIKKNAGIMPGVNHIASDDTEGE